MRDWRRRGSCTRPAVAGAQSVLDILLAGLEPTVEVTEREVDRVEALSDELSRFAEEVEARASVNASAARECRHWSPLMRMRQRAKLSVTIPQTPTISLVGAFGHSSEINTIPTSARTMPTTISTSRCVTQTLPGFSWLALSGAG
jgi:hypothetical protein